MNRRTFLWLIGAGGAAALFGARGCYGPKTGPEEGGPAGEKDRTPEYVSRGSNGVLYVNLPGYSLKEMHKRNIQSREGFVVASKGNPTRSIDLITGKYAQSIAKQARRHDVSPRDIEGIIYIESGGNRNAIASSGAAGLTQIMPYTAELYHMGVDFATSDRLTGEIDDLDEIIMSEPNPDRREKLKEWRLAKEIKRMHADPRFDPYKSIAFTAKYLADEQEAFGRDDFAIWAYHAGRPAIVEALERFLAPKKIDGSVRDAVKKHDLSYDAIYFGCSPFRENPDTYRLLRDPSIFGDSSIQYPWNVQASSDLIALSKSSPVAFERLLKMYENPVVNRRLELIDETTKWHQPTRRPYRDVFEISEDLDRNNLVQIPNDPRTFGFTLDKGIGELADPEVRDKFRSTKPQTLGMLIALAALTRQESDKYGQHLTLTSAVRSEKYQELLGGSSFSTHTLGLGLDISRAYESERQATAFMHALDLLQDLDHIRYVREDDAHIHITINPNPEVSQYYKQVYREAMKLAA